MNRIAQQERKKGLNYELIPGFHLNICCRNDIQVRTSN
jgi:hypothetical protein